MHRKKLAIVTSHPIQYYAPVFQRLAAEASLEVKVFYTWEKEAAKFDRDFGKELEWDIPLLDGYDYSFVSNNNNMGRGFWDVRNPGLVAAITLWGANAILVIGWNYRSHLQAMFHFKGKIPVLFRGDSTLLDENPGLKQWLRRIFLKFIYRQLDFALYVGNANREYFRRHGIREKQLLFTPHAIDNERFETITRQQEEFVRNTRRDLGIGPDDITLVYAGKFQPKKNVLFLAKAVLELDCKTLHLVLVGNGEQEALLREVISGHTRMHILPFQNQSLMPAVYRLGDIFCLPSGGPGETWGLAVNEAMAAGRAVLVSDKAGCSANLVQEGINGYSFRSGDLADLQQKIILLAASSTNLEEMGHASKEIIAAWSFNNIVINIKDHLDKI